MKKTLVAAIFSVLIISLSGLTSCKSKTAPVEPKKPSVDQVKTIEGEIKKNVYPLPTSADVIKMLAEVGVGYLTGISNPAENVKKNYRRAEQATNLGVYGADLSYATLYNVQTEVVKYLGATRLLANELNMSKLYDESLYERIKINIDNRDTLVAILTEAFDNTYSYLCDNNQQVTALLVVGGAWVEGMHLTTHVSYAAYHIPGISKVLLEQKKSFELYLKITEPFLDDPNLREFISWLEPMKQVYAGLTTSLKLEDVNNIKKAIEGVRSKIVL
jgi:hypothetical protein